MSPKLARYFGKIKMFCQKVQIILFCFVNPINHIANFQDNLEKKIEIDWQTFHCLVNCPDNMEKLEINYSSDNHRNSK